ncbi:MAG: class D sortase [Caldibacillus sp.]
MKRILNILATILLITGMGLVIYSLTEIFKGEQEVKKARAEAEEILQQQPGEKSKKDHLTADDFHFAVGDTIGLLYIPKLDRDLPIIEGTNPEELERGVGHYLGTALPGQKDQIVLSGHRDTVFRNFDQLAIGDTFVLKLPYGTFEYEIFDTEIVSADDTTVIRSTAPEEILTVTTCYPFYFIGNAPDRFIFYAKPVDENS